MQHDYTEAAYCTVGRYYNESLHSYYMLADQFSAWLEVYHQQW